MKRIPNIYFVILFFAMVLLVAAGTEVVTKASRSPTAGDLDAAVTFHHPFHSSSQYGDWKDRNCHRCRKYINDVNKTCDIDRALVLAYYGHGDVSEDIARRMGFLDAPVNALTWPCPEFEER